MESNPRLRQQGTVDPDKVAEARVLNGSIGSLAGYIANGDPEPVELAEQIVILVGKVDEHLAPQTRRAHLRVVA